MVSRFHHFLFLPLALAFALPAHTAQNTTVAKTAVTYVKQGNILKLLPGARLSTFSAMPAKQLIVTPEGRRATLRQWRNAVALMNKLQAKRVKKQVPAVRSGAPVIPLRDKFGIISALNRPANTVLVLPSGKKLTVGQFNILKKSLEQGLGRPVFSAAGAKGGGKVVRVAPGTDVATLLKRPDSDVLVNPKGKRILVGELRAYMKSARPAATRSGTGSGIRSRRAGTKAAADIYRTSSGKVFRGDQAARLLSLPGSETVTGPNGKTITVAELRRMRGTHPKPPPTLKLKPYHPGTIKLPSGGSISVSGLRAQRKRLP